MTIRKIAELLEAKVILGEDKLDLEVDMAFSSDMMSDVLAYVHGRTVLHQRHPLFQRPDRHRKEAVTCP